MSDKIQPQHLNRKAVLYVRQSSPHQVLHNQESQRLQYAMRERLQLLGWEEVEVIDEDLGCSASGSAQRSGFERMMAAVSLGEVGVVAAREVSRFARNSREWQRLVEVCRIVDTVLVDSETVYAPRQSNDRLLLGLKGSLNEYELDLLRQRSAEARREKAKRGELIVAAPVGFLKTEDQRLEKDPDQRVQEAIRLVFRKFQELGSARQTLLWFQAEGLQLPRQRTGSEVTWRRPNYSAVYSILTHPAYGGAYAYGKSEQVVSPDGQTKRSRRKPRERWLVLIPESHEGYVSWKTFEQVGRMLASNSNRGTGAAKRGVALLSGLLRCRRCGRKLMVNYTGREHDVLRYACRRGQLDNGEPRCIAFGGLTVDQAIGEQVLRVVAPAGLEAAVLASEQAQQHDNEVRAAFQRDLQAARYQADRAGKQFDACDPGNRLVADELERRWNATLAEVRSIESRLAEHENREHPQVSFDEFAELAADLESVWNAPQADPSIKKRIVRTLIEEIAVDSDAEAGEIILVIHWKGGVHTELRLPRRKRGYAYPTSIEAIEAVRSLARVCTDDVIAGALNRNGLRTGRGDRWTRERVTSLRGHNKIPSYNRGRCTEEGWLKLKEAADIVGVSTATLRLAIERDEIPGEHPLPDGPWVINRSDVESEAAKQLHQRAQRRNLKGAKPSSEQQNLDFLSTSADGVV